MMICAHDNNINSGSVTGAWPLAVIPVNMSKQVRLVQVSTVSWACGTYYHASLHSLNSLGHLYFCVHRI